MQKNSRFLKSTFFEASKVFMFSVCEVISHEEVFCKDENLNLIDENFGNENEKKIELRR